MVWVYEQKFDGLNNGDLNGQDNWAGSADFDVSEQTPPEGTKSVLYNSDSDLIDRAVAEVASGIVYITIRADGNSAGTSHAFILRAGGANATRVQVATNNIFATNGAGTDDIGDYVNEVPFRVGIEFDVTTDQARFNVNGGAWTGWKDFANAVGNIDEIRFLADEGTGAYDKFYDYISPNYAPPAVGFKHSQGHTL